MLGFVLLVLGCTAGIGNYFPMGQDSGGRDTYAPDLPPFEVVGSMVALEGYNRGVALMRDVQGHVILCASNIDEGDEVVTGEVACVTLTDQTFSSDMLEANQVWTRFDEADYFGSDLYVTGEHLAIKVSRWPSGEDDGLVYLVPVDAIAESWVLDVRDIPGVKTVYLDRYGDTPELIGQVVVADFNGDEAPDLLAPSTGVAEAYVWYDFADHATFASSQYDQHMVLGGGWRPGNSLAYNGSMLATGSHMYRDSGEQLAFYNRDAIDRGDGPTSVVDEHAGNSVMPMSDREGAMFVAARGADRSITFHDGGTGSITGSLFLGAAVRSMATCTLGEDDYLVAGTPSAADEDGVVVVYRVREDGNEPRVAFTWKPAAQDIRCGDQVACIGEDDSLVLAAVCDDEIKVISVNF